MFKLTYIVTHDGPSHIYNAYVIRQLISGTTPSSDFLRLKQFPEPNSILLPLNYSGKWMHDNLSNYFGNEKNILVLDNYEANTPHFPVEWKKDRSPIRIMGKITGR